ncbi:transcriptional regulator, HxlR family [Aeromicrobium marinum DSM 15272]|uniref:Transcriptional regulator, HxlR family n=1 Tax=Aeromicrobium marinum DSM 15272 TaxID=585531 RepID=E2S823_9ACTN|nr:helix-turn-helix domain-containing protein [Aeromicrobium marinum]EFQ84839.1 transcriptional regulator, HxlR family [Aeromicrobium marinum DSM 15272]
MTSAPDVRLDEHGEVTPLEAGGPNAIAVSNGVLADEWSLWIIRHALWGATRYTDWMNLGPIPGSALTTRLASLVAADILRKQPYSERPVRHEYVLTARGRQVWPILIAIWAWERGWVHEVDLPRMRHTTCGEFFDPVLTCGGCRHPIQWREVDAKIGPSGDWNRNLPTTARRQRSRNDPRPSEVIDETMELIGNRWSSAILGASFLGATRFSDFQKRLSASPTIIADRLRVFAELGVLAQTPTAERADWMEYRLTAKGQAFLPVVLLMIEWGHRWYEAPDGPALLLHHIPCTATLHSILHCSACNEPLNGHAIEAVPSDGTSSV